MKFSLQFLLALTLLCAIAVNAWLTRSASLKTKQEVDRLVGESQFSLTTDVDGVAEKRDLYKRYLASYDAALAEVDRRSDDFRIGAEEQARNVSSHPSQIYAKRLPEYQSPEFKVSPPTNRRRNRSNANSISEADVSFVVHVPPQGGKLEVRQSIRANNPVEFSTKRTLHGAKNLAAVWPWEMELPPGKSTIRLVWQKGESLAAFWVNGESAFEFKIIDEQVDLEFETKTRDHEQVRLFEWSRVNGSEFEILTFSVKANAARGQE